jgi:uracil-DNA glycosylase
MHQLTFPPSFTGWQRAARRALQEQWTPDEILWQELNSDQPLLDIGEEVEPAVRPASRAKVPKRFVELAAKVACHSDPERWGLLYRVLWRLTHGEHELMQIVVDPGIHKLQQMEKAIRHDVHKMRAFVRFRAVQHEGETWYVAWFEPAHHIVELNAPFFVDRFANMCWSILTPDRCAHWDGKSLSFTNGVVRSEAPTEDATESLWIKYFSSIFNPARVKVHAMQAEMPKKYWKNLPEAAVIPALLREAPARVNSMMAKSRAKKITAIADARQVSVGKGKEEFHPAPVPETKSLVEVREAAMGCTACPLYKHATQTVFGEGSPHARLVLLGEQPGDREDREGHPFVGPAGQLLNRALEDAGIDRKLAYVTNAVKHFKWKPVREQRLHQRPAPREIAACRPWLAAEMGLIQPELLVCLGSTAAQTLLGNDVRVLRDRGQFVASEFCPQTFITVHPSSLLRAPDEETRARDYAQFVADLRLVAKRLQ